METQGAGTSFDVICDKSQLRHYKIIDRVRKGLQKSQPQSDQTESELQRLKDEAQEILDGVLRDEFKLSDELVSAEYYAERLDIVLWARYQVNHNVVEQYPFDGPEFDQSHKGTSAPEHFRIRESLKQPTETVAGPSSSAAPARPPPQAEGDGKVQDGMADVTKTLGNLDLSQNRSGFPWSRYSSPSRLSLAEEKSTEWTFSSQFRPRSPMVLLTSPPVPMTQDEMRSRFTAAAKEKDAVMNQQQRDEKDRAQAKADEAGMSLDDYLDNAAPVKDKFTLETAADREAAASSDSKPDSKPVTKPVTKPDSKPVTKPVTKPDTKPVSKPDTKPVSKAVTKPATKPATERSSGPAKMSWAEEVEEEQEPIKAQAVPPAPNPYIPLAGAAKPKPAQAPPVSQPSTAPKDNAAAAQKAAPVQKPPPNEKPVVRPVREDLAQNVRDRVLSLELRQEIWDEHFTNCHRQEGAEPLQVQIPSRTRSSLLIGEIVADSEGTTRCIFDKLQRYLPCGIDVIYQDPADKRFGFVLLYIGLKHVCKTMPQSHVSINALHSAWDILFHWACLVEQGYKIDVATFAQWKVDEEIEARYHRLLDRDGLMNEALGFVKKENIPIAQPFVKPRSKRAPRPKPGQHQAEISAERRAANNKLLAMRQSIKDQEKERILARVDPIIEGCRVEDRKAFDAKALDTEFFNLALESGEPRDRAAWIYEGSTAWRKQNLEENSAEQVLFDRAISSWWNNFLGFQSMEQSRKS